MGFQEIEIKSSYETGEDNLLDEFYIPVLENAITYDRIAGFFSSSSLAISAKGIVGLINNGGKMRIIACPKINEDDYDILNDVNTNPEKYLENNLLESLTMNEDMFLREHVYALGWLVANQLLEIKIAFVLENGKISRNTNLIFHQKVGILKDKYNNIISFSGSINESANGWLRNIEEFKVFKSWELGQVDYLNSDIGKFEEFWNGKRSNVSVVNLPKVIENRLIEFSDSFKMEKIAVENYMKNLYIKNIDELKLFYYQKEAIEKWKKNNRRLLFEMATGTGKTRTAIGCIADTLNFADKIIIIIACPQGTLSLQWKEEIEKLNIKTDIAIIVDGTNKKWKTMLKQTILELEINYYKNMIIYTTHKTSSKEEFIKCFEKIDNKIKILFIGDEAHGLGAFNSRRALLERYNYRLGLSATPSRWFDENGTAVLERYFGQDKYEFSISDALTTINPLTKKTFLVNYYYYLSLVELEESEVEEYKKLSKQVSKLRNISKTSDEYYERFERLLFKRANIVKNANKKYEELEKILKSKTEIKDSIIFVSNEQIDIVLNILKKLKISAHKLTQNEKTIPNIEYGGKSEREDIIDKFKKGYYQVLVAIKCLDEGIDIPSATTAILMASSSNPREYVQRIGRVIRQAPNKKNAYIYDISIKPYTSNNLDLDLLEFEKMIINKERNRLIDISKNALNNAEALEFINSVLEV